MFKKTIFYVSAVVVMVCFSSFSGCILKDLLFGTSFSLKSYEVCDDDGFAGLSLGFSATDTVTVKLYGLDGSVLDSDLFLYGDSDAVFHLASYKETVKSGQYVLRVYDKNNKKISEKTFSFGESNISITSCSQKWWKREAWKGGYSLIGITMGVHNNGDTPVYPYMAEVTMDSETISGLVLPVVMLPDESRYVDCFVYREDTPEDSTFTVSLKDVFDDALATDSFSIVLDDNVPVKEFEWTYSDIDRTLSIPYPKFLFDYYSSINRIRSDDYGVYVFDSYDDSYIDVLASRLMFGFYDTEDVARINFVASFVQSLEYKKDSATNESFEYPRYPVETLFNGNGGGDCEDKAILTASILDRMGYDVALFRLPNHMAVGVHLDENISDYEYYTGKYYFLETTTEGKPLGFIPSTPSDCKSRSNLTVYPVSSRPLLIHNWKNNVSSIFTKTERGDFIKVTLIVTNLGSETAKNIMVKGGFYTQSGLELNAETDVISALKPMMKEEITLMVDIPKGVTAWFKTRIYLNNEVVDEQESASSFS